MEETPGIQALFADGESSQAASLMEGEQAEQIEASGSDAAALGARAKTFPTPKKQTLPELDEAARGSTSFVVFDTVLRESRKTQLKRHPLGEPPSVVPPVSCQMLESGILGAIVHPVLRRSQWLSGLQSGIRRDCWL